MSGHDDVTGPFDPKRALRPGSAPPPALTAKERAEGLGVQVGACKKCKRDRGWEEGQCWSPGSEFCLGAVVERLIVERDAALAEVARLHALLGEDADQ